MIDDVDRASSLKANTLGRQNLKSHTNSVNLNTFSVRVRRQNPTIKNVKLMDKLMRFLDDHMSEAGSKHVGYPQSFQCSVIVWPKRRGCWLLVGVLGCNLSRLQTDVKISSLRSLVRQEAYLKGSPWHNCCCCQIKIGETWLPPVQWCRKEPLLQPWPYVQERWGD